MSSNHPLSDEKRLKASIAQIYTYGDSQYTMWRVAAVKSIEKILLNLDDFYNDLLPVLEMPSEEGTKRKQDVVHLQIRNGWFFEAVSQAEQAIEDLFSMLLNIGDLEYFAKTVITYDASRVKKYIWDFKADDLEYVTKEFCVPFFPLDEEWENKSVFESYRSSLLLMQNYIKELQGFHRKHYLDYCQYKHGLSVGLKPYQNPLFIGDQERLDSIMKHPYEAGLITFHSGTIEKYHNRTGMLPAIGMMLTHETQEVLGALHNEGNLLYFTIHHADIREVVKIVEHACMLLDVVWRNTLNRCNESKTTGYQEYALPINEIGRYCVIGFPIE